MAQALDPVNLRSFAEFTSTTPGGHNQAELDRETVELVGQHFSQGIFQPPANINEIIDQADQGDFDTLFVNYIDTSPLSAVASPVQHRALALERTVLHLAEAYQVSAATRLRTDELRITPDDLTAYLAVTVPKLANIPAELQPFLLNEAVFLTPEELGKLTRMTVNTLAAWRNTTGGGPRFLKLHGKRPSIRYPAAAVLEWIQTQRVSA